MVATVVVLGDGAKACGVNPLDVAEVLFGYSSPKPTLVARGNPQMCLIIGGTVSLASSCCTMLP